MKKRFWKVLLSAVVAALMVMSISACGAKKDSGSEEEPKTFIDVTDDGGVICYLDKTGKGTGGGSGMKIEEGEYLVIDTELTEGKVHVKVTAGGSDMEKNPVEADTEPTIDYVFEESGKTEYMEIEAGDYMIGVDVEETASGTIAFSKAQKPVSAEESAEESAEDASTAAAPVPAN